MIGNYDNSLLYFSLTDGYTFNYFKMENQMKRKYFILVLCFFIIFCGSSVFSYDKIEVEITEVPYVEPYAFLGVTFETGGSQSVGLRDVEDSSISCSQTGFSLWMMSARHNQDFQFQTHLGYKGIDVSEFDLPNLEIISNMEIFIGGRFFPRYPTFALSKLPVRLTFSALGGLCWVGDNMAFSMLFSAGFVISSKDNPTGMTFEIGYRPGLLYKYQPDYVSETEIQIDIEPSWIFRIGFLFGP